MVKLAEQLRAYGEYLDELSPPLSPSPIRAVTYRPRRRFAFAAIAVALVAAVAAVVVFARTDGPSRVTTNASVPDATNASVSVSTATTTPVPEAAIAAENPTLDQQIARLERWYESSPADAPGGRPLLAAEYVFCDSGAPASAAAVRGTFASNFPLGQPLTEARIAEACARSDSPDARLPAGAAFTLCATTRRGPVYDLTTTATNPVTRPVLVYGAAGCAAAGYAPAADGLLDRVNALRNIEIDLRAVPRDCPTEQEATAWVRKVTNDQLGQQWTIGSPANSNPPSTGCYRPFLVEWETHQVHFLVSPRS